MTLPSAGGVLPVDKPVGPTSHDVVARARRALATRQVGHTGTLDPFASGLLLLVVGPATRLSPYLTGLDKRYVAEARLGMVTETLDPEGPVVAENEGWRAVGAADVATALAGLEGAVLQRPPAYSAKKIGGEAAHRRARRGEEVVLAPVEVSIHELRLLEARLPWVTFSVHCSSGTYVRSIARDLGEALGVGAHLTALRRTAVGDFQVGDAMALDALEAGTPPSWVTPALALERAGFPLVAVDDDAVSHLAHGRVVDAPGGAALANGSTVAAVDGAGDLVAVAEIRPEGLRPRKVFRAAGAPR